MTKKLLVTCAALAGSLVMATAGNATVTPIDVGDIDGDYFAPTCGFTLDGKLLQGDNANDKVVGTNRRDLLRGGGGRDKIKGLRERDCIFGQAGADKITGKAGDDLIRGGADNDNIRAGGGNDQVRLQRGDDKVWGGTGNDRIRAKGGKLDIVNCGPGDDRVVLDRHDIVRKNCEHVRVIS